MMIELLSGKKIVFKPYKGLFIVDDIGNSHEIKSIDKNGPLREVVEVLSHGKFHTLSNLLDLDGNKIFSKGVPSIKFQKEGYYIVEDNNEDDLINRYGYLNDEYWEKQCVVLSNGKILSNKWYDKVSPLPNHCVKVWKNDKENILTLNGNLLLDEFVDFVSYFNGDHAYYTKNNVIYKQYTNGKTCRVGSLYNLSNTEEYIVPFRTHIKNGKIIGSDLSISDLYFSGSRTIFHCTKDAAHGGGGNILFKNGKILFRKWYNGIGSSSIPGLYYVQQDGMWNIVDITGKKLVDNCFMQITCFYSGFAIAQQANGTYCIIDISGKIVASGFNSVLRIPHTTGMWEVEFYSQNENKTFFHGEGGAFIFIVHDILLYTQGIGLFEKDNLWYYLNNHLQMKPLFKYVFAPNGGEHEFKPNDGEYD